jgi:hypothetical protein
MYCGACHVLLPVLTGDVAIEVHEGGEVLQLLSHDEAQRGQHGHTAVHDLGLAPAADILDAGSAGQVQGVEHVGEGLADAGQGLQVCGANTQQAKSGRLMVGDLEPGRRYRGWGQACYAPLASWHQ